MRGRVLENCLVGVFIGGEIDGGGGVCGVEFDCCEVVEKVCDGWVVVFLLGGC